MPNNSKVIVMHAYQHHKLKPPRHLKQGDIVEHKLRPGEPLTVVSGPEQGVTGPVYLVTWGGEAVPVKKVNLII